MITSTKTISLREGDILKIVMKIPRGEAAGDVDIIPRQQPSSDDFIEKMRRVHYIIEQTDPAYPKNPHEIDYPGKKPGDLDQPAFLPLNNKYILTIGTRRAAIDLIPPKHMPNVTAKIVRAMEHVGLLTTEQVAHVQSRLGLPALQSPQGPDTHGAGR